MEIQLIRNATLKVIYGDKTFLIDPFFADKHSLPSFAGKSPNPICDLPYSIDQILSGIDFILISHLHLDHFDPKAIQCIPKDTKIFCQPADLAAIQKSGFTNVEPIVTEIETGTVRIQRTECQHGEGAILRVMGHASGFIFKCKTEKTVYWMGDTILTDDVKKHIRNENPGVIVCHAGGNRFLEDYNVFGEHFKGDSGCIIMNEKQVADLCEIAGDSIVIATHLEALDHGTTTRNDFKILRETNVLLTKKILVPEDGEILIL